MEISDNLPACVQTFQPKRNKIEEQIKSMNCHLYEIITYQTTCPEFISWVISFLSLSERSLESKAELDGDIWGGDLLGSHRLVGSLGEGKEMERIHEILLFILIDGKVVFSQNHVSNIQEHCHC